MSEFHDWGDEPPHEGSDIKEEENIQVTMERMKEGEPFENFIRRIGKKALELRRPGDVVLVIQNPKNPSEIGIFVGGGKGEGNKSGELPRGWRPSPDTIRAISGEKK